MAVALVGVFIARRHDGILFCLDHQPAAIGVVVQQLQQRPEIDRAVAGNGEGAVDDRFEKAPVAIACHAYHPRSNVLAMDVTHAPNVFGKHRRRGVFVGCGKAHVPAVEQQADFVANQRHQLIDVGGRLNVRAHMVVIRQSNTARKSVTRERGDPVGVVAPLFTTVKARALVQRRRTTLDAVGHFTVDHHLGAVVGK